VWKTLLVVAIGLFPPVLSFWVIRKVHMRARSRLRRLSMTFPSAQGRYNLMPEPGESDRHYLEGVGFLIGDISCQYNARSAHIRCAINPCGPCEGCRDYQSRELSDSKNMVG